MKKLQNRGDTIVEVLISIAITSVVLVGSITVANTSLKQIRMAQERSEAQKIGTGAVEGLDVYLDTHAHTAFGSKFCRTPGSNTLVNAAVAANCNFGTDNRYHVSSERLNNGTTNTYKTTVSWDGLNGSPQNVEIVYRTRLP